MECCGSQTGCLPKHSVIAKGNGKSLKKKKELREVNSISATARPLDANAPKKPALSSSISTGRHLCHRAYGGSYVAVPGSADRA